MNKVSLGYWEKWDREVGLELEALLVYLVSMVTEATQAELEDQASM